MKKNILAVSISAAVLSFGLVGGAQAVTSVTQGGSSTAVTAATNLALNNDGVGHMLVVPYYTAQAENRTLINLVNTDATNGKAVKVRFRGAANSDDVLDFQVFLSPGDVWTASISKDSVTGLAQLTTTDNTCMIPAKATGKGATTTLKFSSSRLDTGYMTGVDALAAGTREGYVEIFNMADIPPGAGYPSTAATDSTNANTVVGYTTINTAGIAATSTSTANPLFTAIKHVNQEAPCGALLNTTMATLDPVWEAEAVAAKTLWKGTRTNGLLQPTTGLMANWTIINIAGAAAWSGKAVAIEARDAAAAAAKGNIVFFPQTVAAQATPEAFTADPLLRTGSFRYNSDKELTSYEVGNNVILPAAITAQTQDLPDMSTPYVTATTPQTQAVALMKAFSAQSARNEFLTDSSISASTDWVFSMPTRRYNAALNYAKIGEATSFVAKDTGVRYTNLSATTAAAGPEQWVVGGGTQVNDAFNYFNTNNAKSVELPTVANSKSRVLCVTGITTSHSDREETVSTLATSATVSPSPVASILSFCGEDAVLSFNLGPANNGLPSRALKSTLTLKDLDLNPAGALVNFVDGWMTISTPGLVNNVTTAVATTTTTSPTTLTGVTAPAHTASAKGLGLPVIGGTFFKASAGTSSFGTYFDHRFTR